MRSERGGEREPPDALRVSPAESQRASPKHQLLLSGSFPSLQSGESRIVPSRTALRLTPLGKGETNGRTRDGKTMKTRAFEAIAAFCLAVTLSASAVPHYVDANGTNATPPFLD